MAISVLGKRSRRVLDAEDIHDHLPAAKRKTRGAAPHIFEDRENLSKATDTAGTGSPRVPSKRSRNTPAARHVHNTTVPFTRSDDGMTQDENVPPHITATPTANRIHDVLGLPSPSTPKHRIRLTGLPLTPRRSRDGVATPKAPSVFAAARQLFAPSNSPHRLIGRETERVRIHDFVTEAAAANSGGCMYVSGAPGTGKSAVVHDVFQQFQSSDTIDVSIVNCVSLNTPASVYGKLLNDFAPETCTDQLPTKQLLSQLFRNKLQSRPRLVLLDEIDNLLDADCDILYTLFEWALQKSSSLILVGIANALDLTDRFLPRLKAKGLRPELMPFLPYNASQISDIITAKLRSLLSTPSTGDVQFVPFMQPAAIQLCGKKIASQTGDLRKAFSLVRRILDQVEKEAGGKTVPNSPAKQPLGEVANMTALPSPASTPVKTANVECNMVYSIENAPRASIAHVARVAASIFNNSSLSRLSGLNLQQKAVLCSLVGGEKRKEERNPYITPSKSSNRTPTVRDLFTKYTLLCRRDDGLLQPLQATEFRDVVASLETLGLLHEHRGRTSSLLTPTSSSSRGSRHHDDKPVVSAVSEKEMRDSLDGAGADLLRRLLDEA